MKKAILSLLTVLTLSSFAQVQLKIEDAANPGTNIDGATITVVDVASVFEIELNLHVINEGANTVKLAVRTSEIDVCAHTSNATCWLVCPPFNNAGDSPVQTSAFSETIAPNDTVFSFAAHYKPDSLNCCSMFKYEWLDKDNFNAVVASVIVRFDHTNAGTACAVSVKEQEVNADVSISPNPANSEVLIALNGVDNFNGISIDIFDLLGKKVGSLSNIVNKNNMDVSAFNNGVYFVSIMKYGSLLKTTKLIVE